MLSEGLVRLLLAMQAAQAAGTASGAPCLQSLALLVLGSTTGLHILHDITSSALVPVYIPVLCVLCAAKHMQQLLLHWCFCPHASS